MNDFISRFIMVMIITAVTMNNLENQYICWCIKKPIEFQMTVIKKLQDIGYLKMFDARHITLEY